jgi:hypothetical protein
VFGYRIGRICRYPDYGDSQPVCGQQIDVVEPRRTKCDKAGSIFMQVLERCLIDPVIDEDTDRGKTCCQRRRRLWETWLEVMKSVGMSVVRTVKEQPVVRLRGE